MDSAAQGTNGDRTPFDDNVVDGTNFFQVELRSVSPKSVALATTVSNTATTGIWRIHRDDNFDATIDATTENALIFSSGTGSVAPGALFTIASADLTSVGSASLYIDYTGTASTSTAKHAELIAPNLTTGTVYIGTTLPPEANLDLLHASACNSIHAAKWRCSNGKFSQPLESPAWNCDIYKLAFGTSAKPKPPATFAGNQPIHHRRLISRD